MFEVPPAFNLVNVDLNKQNSNINIPLFNMINVDIRFEDDGDNLSIGEYPRKRNFSILLAI